MNVKLIIILSLYWILTLVLHVNVYAYQRFSSKGVRACVRTHPDNNFECMLSRRSACQSYLARPVHRNKFFMFLFYVAQKSKKVYQPFHPRSALQRLNFQGRVARSSMTLNLRAVDVLGWPSRQSGSGATRRRAVAKHFNGHLWRRAPRRRVPTKGEEDAPTPLAPRQGRTQRRRRAARRSPQRCWRPRARRSQPRRRHLKARARAPSPAPPPSRPRRSPPRSITRPASPKVVRPRPGGTRSRGPRRRCPTRTSETCGRRARPAPELALGPPSRFRPTPPAQACANPRDGHKDPPPAGAPPRAPEGQAGPARVPGAWAPLTPPGGLPGC